LILIDTDVLTNSLRNGKRVGDAISAIALLEFIRGTPSEKREEVKRLLEETYEVIWLDNSILLEYSRLYDVLKEEGSLIGDADLLIAATAISKGMELLTGNLRHFARLRRYGLRLKGMEARSGSEIT